MDELKEITRILISQEDICRRNKELADEITKEYIDRSLTIIVILNGALFFGSDLLRGISIPVKFDSLSISSYIGAKSSKRIQLHTDLKIDITGKDILVVDDIFDTGSSLHWIMDYLTERKPDSIRTCVLLEKTKNRETDITPDYVGFHISDEFVVGYGLDFNESFRNLPYIGVLDPNCYS